MESEEKDMELKLGVAKEVVESDDILATKKIDREEYCAIELEMKNTEGKKSLFGKVKASVKRVINYGESTAERDADCDKINELIAKR